MMGKWYWLGKLSRLLVVSYFPKKLNMALAVRCMTLEATMLGFKELVQDESKTKEVQVKCKQGRHVGDKSKKGKVLKKPGLESLYFTYCLVAPSFIPYPTDKGNEKKN